MDGYLTVGAEGFIMAGRARADLFADCVGGIERGEMVSPFIASLEAQVRYCTVDELFGGGHPPDGFVALALAYRASGQTAPADVSEDEMQAIWRAQEAGARATAPTSYAERPGSWEDFDER